MAEEYRFVLCPNADCDLRFPGEVGVPCPLCKTTTCLASERCVSPEDEALRSFHSLDLLLDNVRSVFNVGSIFRSADGAGVSHIYLGGITPSPQHKAMRKTALGAEEWIPWSAHANGARLARELVERGHTLWALERTASSVDLFKTAHERPLERFVLVVGNEVTGVDPGVLEHCDRTVHIPMRGEKASLNVATAAGIAAYAVSPSVS